MSDRDPYFDDAPPDPEEGMHAARPGAAPGRPERPGPRSILSGVLVVAGIGLFGGIIWYAYTQGMRAGTESVAPILRADPNPTKVRPEQPGGMNVPHQDKLVFDRLDPQAAPSPGMERLLPPPEPPMQKPQPVEPEPVQTADTGASAPGPEVEQPPAAPELPPAPEAASAGPVQKAEAPVPKPEAPKQAAEAPKQAAEAPKPVLEAPKPAAETPKAVVETPKPPPALVETARPEPPKAPKPAAGAAVHVQVAAVDSEMKAAIEWTRLQRRHPAELGSLGLRVQRVQASKGTFFRIQGGPVDEARADKICQALKAQNVGCIIVR